MGFAQFVFAIVASFIMGVLSALVYSVFEKRDDD